MKEHINRMETRTWRSGQKGQTIIFVVLGLSLVFLAVLGFAVDFGNLWFHRQGAQTAADAACTAAAMNMLDNAQGGSSGGFAWNGFDCAALPASAPCKYLNLNGYSVTGLKANATSSGASFTFANSVTGVPTCTIPPDPKYTMCIPPGSALGPSAQPVVQVSLTDRIKAPFFSLIAARSTIDVPAKSSCGVVLATSALPITVLYPRTDIPSLTGNGNINIAFYGGPNRSVQVNGRGINAVDIDGSGTIDVSQGGPNNTGSDFGVTGNTPQPRVLLPAIGHYTSPASPTSDPFALVNAPEIPTAVRPNNGFEDVSEGQYGCPATNCRHFQPGYYPTGIRVNGEVAIFDPGIYYVQNGFTADSCMRQSTAQGDGSGGTAFYLADTSSIRITSTGANCNPSDPFNVLSGPSKVLTNPNYLANGIRCTPSQTIPTNITSSITGTVLLAPCTGPDPSTNLCYPNCNLNAGNGLGDQLNTYDSGSGTWGTSDPIGIQRGILFFQNRSLEPSQQPSWQTGNDQFLLSGTLYFHQCTTTGTFDVGTGCDTADAFNDQFTFGGGSGFNTFFLGNIVADQLNLTGSQMTIDLNPSTGYWVLKASLLQ